jgi:hypothetical protein
MSIKIEFSRYDGLEDPFPPLPASKYLPEWYQNAQSYWNDTKKPQREQPFTTVKKCIPVFDSITSGYILRTNQDMYVDQTDNGPYFHWREDASPKPGKLPLISEHSEFQAQGHPLNDYGYQLKLDNPWLIKTPKGYSCMFIPPMHRENPIVILPGVIDTDRYYERVHFPFNLKEKNFEGMIPAGTAIAQVVPFKRESYKMEVTKPDTQKQLSTGMKTGSKLFDAYRNLFWVRKEYK